MIDLTLHMYTENWSGEGYKTKYCAERKGAMHFLGWGDTQEEAIENYYKQYPDEK